MYKTNISWIADGEDKITRSYNAEEKRLDELVKRAKELRNELEAVNNEIYKIEYSLLGRN